jgi:hypothetical protein
VDKTIRLVPERNDRNGGDSGHSVERSEQPKGPPSKSYSITSSALASSIAGISAPSALAVFRLTIVSSAKSVIYPLGPARAALSPPDAPASLL